MSQATTKRTIANLCRIQPYRAPQYLIQPYDNAWNEAPDQFTAILIESLNDGSFPYDVIESGLQGWGQHTHIIRHTYGGSDAYEDDFLATIVNAS